MAFKLASAFYLTEFTHSDGSTTNTNVRGYIYYDRRRRFGNDGKDYMDIRFKVAIMPYYAGVDGPLYSQPITFSVEGYSGKENIVIKERLTHDWDYQINYDTGWFPSGVCNMSIDGDSNDIWTSFSVTVSITGSQQTRKRELTFGKYPMLSFFTNADRHDNPPPVHTIGTTEQYTFRTGTRDADSIIHAKIDGNSDCPGYTADVSDSPRNKYGEYVADVPLEIATFAPCIKSRSANIVMSLETRADVYNQLSYNYAPEWESGKYYKRVLNNGIFTYQLTTSKPRQWDERYYLDYYTLDHETIGFDEYTITGKIPDYRISASFTTKFQNDNTFLSEKNLIVDSYTKLGFEIQFDTNKQERYYSDIVGYEIVHSTNPYDNDPSNTTISVNTNSPTYAGFFNEVLTGKGSHYIWIRAKDSRGVIYNGYPHRTAFSVLEYTKPYASTVNAYRSDSDGKKSYTERSVSMEFNVSYTPFPDASSKPQNFITRTYSIYKMPDMSVVTNGNITNDGITTINDVLDLDKAYRITFVATDCLENSVSISQDIALGKILLHLKEGGMGVGFGRFCDKDDVLQSSYTMESIGFKMLNETGVPMQGLSITPNAFVYDKNDNLSVDANKDDINTYITVSTPGNYLFLSNASCADPSAINFASMNVEQTESGTIHHVVSSEQFTILRLISGSVKVFLRIHNSDSTMNKSFKTFLFGMRIDDYITAGHGPL